MNKKNKMSFLIAVVAMMVFGATSASASEESIMDTIHALGYEYIGWQEENVTYRSGEIYSDHIGMDQDPPTGVISATAADLDGDGQEELLLVLLEETEREYDTSGGKDSRLAFLVCENQDGKWIESQSISTAVRYGTEEQENMATIADVLVSTTVELFPTEEGYHILVNHPFYTVFADSAYETVIERTEIIYTEESITGIKCTSDDEEEFHRLLEIMWEDNDILVSRIYLSEFFDNEYYDLDLSSYENFLNGGEASVTLYLQDFGNLSGIDEQEYEQERMSRPDYVASDFVILPDYMNISVPDPGVEKVTEEDVEEKIRARFDSYSLEYTDLSSITDEQAATLSGRKYQTAQEYIDSVWEELRAVEEFKRSYTIFSFIFAPVEEDIIYTGIPEDVLEYDITSVIVDQDGNRYGASMDEVQMILGDDFEDFCNYKMNQLKEEMFFKCIAEEQGIESGSETAMTVLMNSYDVNSEEDLLACFNNSKTQLASGLLMVDVINYVADHASVAERDSESENDNAEETNAEKSEGIRAAYSKRPEYYASDYVILPDYMGISVPDVSAETVTDTDVEEKISEFFAEESWVFAGLDAVTDEQAVILSNQDDTTAQEFIDAVRNNLELEAEYNRKSAIFDNIFDEIKDKVLFIGYPEDVYEYLISQHMADEETFQTGLWTMDEIREILGDNYEEYAQMVEQALYYEMMFQCMAEQQGIEGGSDYAYQVLMAQKDCFSREDLLNSYVYEDDLPVELLKIDVIDYVVGKADISDSEENAITSENTEVWSDYGDWEEYTFDSGDSYTGFVKDGQFSTWGIYQFASGNVYEGQFENDSFNGYGSYSEPSGSRYEGEFKNGEMDGLGVLFLEDRFVMLGEFSGGKLNGYGAIFMDGSLMEFGLYQDGELAEDGNQYGLTSSDGYRAYGFTVADDSSLSGEGIEISPDNQVFIGKILDEGESGYSLNFWMDNQLQIGWYNSDKDLENGFLDFMNSEGTDYAVGNFDAASGLLTEGLLKFNEGSWYIGEFQDGSYVTGSGIASYEIY